MITKKNINDHVSLQFQFYLIFNSWLIMSLGSRVMGISGSFAEVRGIFQAWPLLMIVGQEVNGRIALVANPEAKLCLQRMATLQGVNHMLSRRAPLHSRSRGVCACLLEIGDGGKERHAAKGSWVQIGPRHLWVSVLRCGFQWRSESQKMSGGLVAGLARECSEWGLSKTSLEAGNFWAGMFGRPMCNRLVG